MLFRCSLCSLLANPLRPSYFPSPSSPSPFSSSFLCPFLSLLSLFLRHLRRSRQPPSNPPRHFAPQLRCTPIDSLSQRALWALYPELPDSYKRRSTRDRSPQRLTYLWLRPRSVHVGSLSRSPLLSFCSIFSPFFSSFSFRFFPRPPLFASYSSLSRGRSVHGECVLRRYAGWRRSRMAGWPASRACARGCRHVARAWRRACLSTSHDVEPPGRDGLAAHRPARSKASRPGGPM